MKMLRHSNGIKKLKPKRNISTFAIIKITIYSVISILLIFAIFQGMLEGIYDEKYPSRIKYTRIDEKKMYYNQSGSGDVTIIFDSDISLDLNEWNTIEKDLRDKYNVKVLQYDRMGYGYSDGGNKIDIQKQADDLKLSLKKANISGPYILVGAGYGSLVMTNFAKSYPDSVKGVVLIDPINEKYIKNNEYIKNYTSKKLEYKAEYISAYFGLSFFRSKVGLLEVPDELFNDSKEQVKDEFLSNRIRSKYSHAIYNEMLNLEEGVSTSQEEGILGNKPLAIVSRTSNLEADKNLLLMSTSKYVNQIATDSNGQFIPLSDKNKTLEAIKYILEKINL